MMRRFALPLLALVLPLAGCIQSDAKYPSLLPRAIESQSTAEPERAAVEVAADPALDKQVDDLSATLDAAQKAFTKAAQDTEAKIAVARDPNWLPLKPKPGFAGWTDNYASIVPVLRPARMPWSDWFKD